MRTPYCSTLKCFALYRKERKIVSSISISLLIFTFFVSIFVATIPDGRIDNYMRSSNYFSVPAPYDSDREFVNRNAFWLTAVLFERRVDPRTGRSRGHFSRNLLVDGLSKQPTISGSENTPPIRVRNLYYAEITNSNMRHVDFRNVSIREINLSGTDLRGARFDSSNLNRSRLIDTNLSYTSFVGAQVNQADFTGANISGANFSAATGIEEWQLAKAWTWSDRIPFGIPIEKRQYMVCEPGRNERYRRAYDRSGVVPLEACMDGLTGARRSRR